MTIAETSNTIGQKYFRIKLTKEIKDGMSYNDFVLLYAETVRRNFVGTYKEVQDKLSPTSIRQEAEAFYGEQSKSLEKKRYANSIDKKYNELYETLKFDCKKQCVSVLHTNDEVFDMWWKEIVESELIFSTQLLVKFFKYDELLAKSISK